jgi:hypothetical protein
MPGSLGGLTLPGPAAAGPKEPAPESVGTPIAVPPLPVVKGRVNGQ